jgi:SHS2 domain-containing protein
MGKYRFLEDVAIADAAFIAEGETLEELFEVCAQAAFEVMADTKTIKHKHKEEIKLAGKNLEELLIGWLAELIYLKDSNAMLFSKFDTEILKRKNGFILKAVVWGEPADQRRHKVRVDVKAVTYYQLEVKQKGGKWTARVVLDI